MDRLKLIFDKQKELMEKYHGIEKASGLMQTDRCPVDILGKEGQARIKDFAWRFIEELSEYLESKESEELIDALHFLTEMTILMGKDYNNITNFTPCGMELDYLDLFCEDGKISLQEDFNNEAELIVNLVEKLGLMCNQLKNRPWKQSVPPLISFDALYNYLGQVWMTFFALLSHNGLGSVDIAEIYINKNNKNKDRQREGY